MSKAGEEEEEDDEEECCFHDSLDRLLSSSNTSCSCSPSTTSEEDSDSNDYDVWISQPSSVEERRIRLLRQMGLIPTLSRSSGKTNITINNSNGIANRDNKTSRASDGECNSSNSVINSVIGMGIDVNNDNNVRGLGTERSSIVKESPPAVSPNKPPTGKVRVDCLTRDEVLEEILECDNDDAVCMIKNLDNGKEFMVNEVRDDGMWEKIKEVETGRQLTMEEFSSEMCVGTSPIVQELMRRQNVEDGNKEGFDANANNRSFGNGSKLKKRGSWLKSIKSLSSSVTGGGYKERRSSDERDTSSEKGGRRSSSATDDSNQDVVSFHGPEKVRVKQYGKTVKDLTALYKSQEIQAHNGSIWTIKFSLDGKYLASAGEDCVIHVWQVIETERKGDFFFDKSEEGNFNLLFLANGSPEPSSLSPKLDGQFEKKRRGRSSISRKSVSLEQILVPERVFALSEKPICSFQGHLDDVLDLSWSMSQKLLSSSMDKTVRLWDLSSKACLKIFSHSDYVTCIQFNPVDDRYFISGSLDSKVRIWSIPDRQVVDWSDMHEMVTAACYTPDGQGALVGSYKGSCRLFNTSENKLQQKSQINLQNKKKKSHHKKITGFQFAPKSTSEVLITSADSRIRVVDGISLVHKFKGFRNMNSQISGSVTSNGKYVVSASEDSYVYVWRNEGESGPNRSKGVTVTQSYELFHCQDVSVAVPWPGMSSDSPYLEEEILNGNNPVPTTPVEGGNSPLNGTLSTATKSYLFDRFSLTWPEEKLVSPDTTTIKKKKNCRASPRVSTDFSNQNNNINNSSSSGWGMVIVSAGLRGEIRTFQNFGLPVRI